MSINWYPGHMVKARRELIANLAMVDVVIEILDARAPQACRNPDLEKLTGKKPVVAVLTKVDVADPIKVRQVQNLLKNDFVLVTEVNALSGQGKTELLEAIEKAFTPVLQKHLDRGRRPRPARVLVMGVPNVGKSTLINAIVGKKAVRTGARPGVTRGKQWVRISPAVELLDTPGMMWPKVENEEHGYWLALLNIIGENAYEEEEVALFLLGFLIKNYPQQLAARYHLKLEQLEPGIPLLEKIGRARGFLNKGDEIDIGKTSYMLLDEFRRGTIGRISLEP
ncbi:MAG: ribosome biogenesis GTPase YlqF [Methylocystaceae bacterium]